MKRILFALSILLFSNVGFAQKAEKSDNYTVVMAQEKEQINAKYLEIKGLLEKNDFAAAKQVYTAVAKMMEQSIATDKKFLQKAKSSDDIASIESKIKTKNHLLEATRGFPTADLAKEGQRIAIYIMEFAFVTGR